MLKLVVLVAIVSLGAGGAANAAHTLPAPPAPPAIPPVPAVGQAAKPHDLYTVETNLGGYNPLTDKYNATVRITSNPCPHVSFDNTLSNIARDADDALAQVHDHLAKIEQDIRKSADQCKAH